MSTPADRLTTAFAKAEATLLNKLAADTYAIVRMVETHDQEGGSTTQETTVESGRCLLQRGGTRGVEGANGTVVLATTDYVAQLPSSTVIEPRDVVDVNDVRYQVTAVKPSGKVGVFTTVELERQT